MPTLFVYLPCYNEAGNLRRLTEEWLAEAGGAGPDRLPADSDPGG
ncbi:MAG: hypothetical protein ACLTC3_05425 [Evtepia gabavorous]